MNETIDPFAGYPATVRRQDNDGYDCFDVTIKALTPLRGKLADKTGLLGALAASGAGLALFCQQPEPGLLAATLTTLAPLALFAPLRLAVKAALSHTTRVTMTRGEITVGARRFDRMLDHSFVLYRNDREKEEAEAAEHRARSRRGRGLFRPRYFAHAPHIVLELMGQRHDVATVLGHDRAAKILARLQACDEHLRRQETMGAAPTMTPLDERGPQLGGLKPEA